MSSDLVYLLVDANAALKGIFRRLWCALHLLYSFTQWTYGVLAQKLIVCTQVLLYTAQSVFA